MPLDIDDYLADTAHLSVTEHGAYMLLIMRYWQNGALPAPLLIRRYAHMSPSEWAESGPRILALFEPDETGYSACDRVWRRHLKRSIPRWLRRLVYARDGQRCTYCGATDGPFQLDHRFPWSRGGKHEAGNLCVACIKCNAAKGALTDSEFTGSDIEGRIL